MNEQSYPVRCKRALIGRLYTPQGIKRNVIVEQDKDGNLTFSPFEKEIHSTSYIPTATLTIDRDGAPQLSVSTSD